MLKQLVAVGVFVAAASAAPRAAGTEQDTSASQRSQTSPAGAAQRDQQVQARYKIFMMEGALERAVEHGADQVRRKVQRVMPDVLLLSGQAQARGFRLDGYGVFFDVAVPAVRPTVAWSLRTMTRDTGGAAAAALQQVRAAIERMVPQNERAGLMQAIRRLEAQVGPMQGAAPVLTGPSQIPPGTVTALDEGEPLATTLTTEDQAVLQDPHAAYEREVIEALKEAMLNYSGSIRIGPEEWLTVAAHDNEQRNRLVPGEQYDLLTIVLRVKGSDLAAFRAERITPEEARKRVLVSEF